MIHRLQIGDISSYCEMLTKMNIPNYPNPNTPPVDPPDPTNIGDLLVVVPDLNDNWVNIPPSPGVPLDQFDENQRQPIWWYHGDHLSH